MFLSVGSTVTIEPAFTPFIEVFAWFGMSFEAAFIVAITVLTYFVFMFAFTFLSVFTESSLEELTYVV